VEHVLLVHRPGESLQRVALGARPLRIGRVAGNDLVLPLPDISRQHCTVQVAAGHGVVTDLGSTNGTWIEGRRIAEPTALGDGTVIGLGGFSLMYRSGSPALLARAIAAEEELRRAGDYVRALLPLPLTQGPLRAEWRFEPSAAVGGDAFGYHRLPDGRWAIYLLDVTGHGAGSALLAVSVLNVLRQHALPQGVAWQDAGGVLAALNAMFPMEQQGGLCLSLWYGLFDPATRRLHYASAGQHPAYLRPREGGPLRPLATRNMMLGAMAEASFVGAETMVPAASRLYLFSDGTFEIRRRDGGQTGLQDFLPLLQAPPEPGLAEADRLLRAARLANGPGPFEDDVSVMVLELA
jgi:serine phosphatase RsbU (regulator of sigma subunit)